jgi:hypothetical protein
MRGHGDEMRAITQVDGFPAHQPQKGFMDKRRARGKFDGLMRAAAAIVALHANHAAAQ